VGVDRVGDGFSTSCEQIMEIKEAVELPLTHPELYEDIGIKPPKGVIL
jgi:26S proteasome regulatory subunit T2